MSEASQFANLLFQVIETDNGKDLILNLGGVPVLVIQNQESAQHILRYNAANYEKSMVWFRQTLGASRFTENGEAWQIRQALSQTYLSRFNRDKTWVAALQQGRKAVKLLAQNSQAGAKTIDDAYLRDLAADIMLRVFFDRPLDATQIELNDIVAMLRFGSEYSFVPEKALIPFPKSTTRDFLKVRTKVLQDLQCFRDGAAEDHSLLSRLRQMDDKQPHGFSLEHEMTMFFAAASETTAATVGWACFLLSRNPDIQEELYQALERFDDFSDTRWKDLQQLQLLRNFILEVLRIFPSTPVIARKAIEADTIGSYKISAGEQVLISLAGIQHDRHYNPNPWAVNIYQAKDRGGNSGQSISFSLGPRMCGGSRFAMLELMTIIAIFIKTAQFQPSSNKPPRFVFQTQLMHDGGQPVQVSLRS